MNDFWNNLGKWITSLPVFISVFIIIFYIILTIFKDTLNDKLKKFNLLSLFRKQKKESKISELQNHDLFNICCKVEDEIKFIEFYNHEKLDVSKTKMAIDFTITKTKEISKTFKEFSLRTDLENISNDQLKQILLFQIQECSRRYIDEIQQIWLNKGINKKDVDFVVNLFDSYRYDVISSFRNRVISIFSSDYYSSNFEKILACYEIFAMAVDLLPKDIKDTFNKINGKFLDIDY